MFFNEVIKMFNLIKNELKKGDLIFTEKGAVGYKSSGSALLDLNYAVSSIRQASELEIVNLFGKAFFENRKYALKWLFFARDVREGLGERRLFRVCYKTLYKLDMRLFCSNLELIAEYGRWDDLVSLMIIDDDYCQRAIGSIIKAQLEEDIINMNLDKPVSLLAKWLPSENASSNETKLLARKIRTALGMAPKNYRQMLSKLRKHLDVVEIKMCNNEWENIDYEKVPSLANLRYKNAFLKHDGIRRSIYLESVSNGTNKMNMSVANPVDVVSKYMSGRITKYVKKYDETLELAWKNLKDIFIEDTLVVADGSGSMEMLVSGKTTALDVANALAIYTSEHNKGVYKDKYITFSNRPQFVDFSDKETLKEKLTLALEHNEISNTNIEAVFDLILNVAVKNDVPADEMVNNVLIISDMEFDAAQRGYWERGNELSAPLFEEIKARYENNGYKLPKLIFWNVNSRTKTIPLIENELGVTLVSGFSQNVLKMVMSNKYDPYEVLIETLENERYDKIVV